MRNDILSIMTFSRFIKALSRRWRHDRLPLLFYFLTFVVMSYPFVFRMSGALPMDNVDTHTALWQNWWMREALSTGQSVLYSDLLFHPNGLDLTFQPRRWTTFPVWTFLYSIFGDPFAFNLTAMMGILFKAYGMYLFGLQLFNSRIPSWVCGGFYVFSAPALAVALQQPNTGATEWIPWFMLALSYGLSKIPLGASGRTLASVMVIAAVFFALNAYMNLKIGIFAMLLGGSYIVLQAFVSSLWQKREFWLSFLVFSISALCFVSPLVFPIFESNLLESALSDEAWSSIYGGIDLLSFVKSNHRRPILYTQFIANLGGENLSTGIVSRDLSNLGIVSFAFALAGVLYAVRRYRQIIIWLAITVGFWLLSLGIEIYFNGDYLEYIYWTPYRVVQDILFFRILKVPSRMILIFLFAFSVLIGYGIHYRLLTIDQSRWQHVLMVISIIMLFFCTSIFPIPLRASPRPQYLNALESLERGAIIDVPMGRQASKYYMSVQRIHRRTIVEGMIARMPGDAYDYAKSNLTLSFLHSEIESKSETSASHDDWLHSLRDLEQYGFRYLVLHRRVPLGYSKHILLPKWLEHRLIMPSPVYEDSNVSIYDIEMWDGPFPTSRQGFGFTALPGRADLSLHFDDSIRLREWALLDEVEVQPCQSVEIESWWQLVTEDVTPYSLVLVLASDNADRQLSIIDKVPADKFTTDWKYDVYYRDTAAIDIPCDLEPGQFPLLLGLKKSLTGEMLEISYPNGSAIGNLYFLTTLYVEH